MAEIQRKPIIMTMPDDEEWVVFDHEHTYADVVRWLLSSGCSKSEVIYLVESEGKT